MTTRRTTLGPLPAVLVDQLPAGGVATHAIVLSHGFGAPGDDLVPLANALLARAPTLKANTVFVFPEAPIALVEYGHGARAWWRIEERYFDLVARGEADPVMRHAPPGLAEARRALRALIEAFQTETQIPTGRLVIGGFSQGAMLATDVTLRLDEPPAGLAILSGAPIAFDDWQRLAPRRKGLPVLITHGTSDTILPIIGSRLLNKALTEAGMIVDSVTFPGGHAIPPVALDALAALLNRVLVD